MRKSIADWLELGGWVILLPIAAVLLIEAFK